MSRIHPDLDKIPGGDETYVAALVLAAAGIEALAEYIETQDHDAWTNDEIAASLRRLSHEHLQAAGRVVS